MVKFRISAGAMLAIALLVVAGTAVARSACPEGRASNGKCIKPGFASAARQRGVIYSQPKISGTQYPIFPWDDWTFRYPNQLINDPLQSGAGGPRRGR